MARPKGGKPRGRPLPATDKALDEAAQITPEDVEAAKAFWRRNAPRGLRDLLDADVEDVV